jgi:hypothetical protein
MTEPSPLKNGDAGVLLEHSLVTADRVGKRVTVFGGYTPFAGDPPWLEVQIESEEGTFAFPPAAIGPAPTKRKVIYLAAPLTAPTREGIEQNRKNAARWAAWLVVQFDVAVECTWIVLTGELEETPDNRKRGLECDLELVERCDELWMVGGRVSSGMKLESDHAAAKGLRVIDLTGFGQVPPTGPEVVALELDAQGSRVFSEAA